MSTPLHTVLPATEFSSADLLPEIVWDADDFAETGPIATLEIQLAIDPELDRKQLPRYLASFVRALSIRENALGGSGMILDRDECEVNSTSIALRLCCLDVRHSQVRLNQLANEIQGMTSSRVVYPESERVEPELIDNLVIEIAKGQGDQGPDECDPFQVSRAISSARVHTVGNNREQTL